MTRQNNRQLKKAVGQAGHYKTVQSYHDAWRMLSILPRRRVVNCNLLHMWKELPIHSNDHTLFTFLPHLRSKGPSAMTAVTHKNERKPSSTHSQGEVRAACAGLAMEHAHAQTSGCGSNIQVEINGTHNSITTLLVDKSLCTLRTSLTIFQDYPHIIKILQHSCNMQTIAKILEDQFL